MAEFSFDFNHKAQLRRARLPTKIYSTAAVRIVVVLQQGTQRKEEDRKRSLVTVQKDYSAMKMHMLYPSMLYVLYIETNIII